MTEEQLSVLQNVYRLIVDMKRRLEILEAKNEVLETMRLALNAPVPSQGYGVDYAHALLKMINDEQKEKETL